MLSGATYPKYLFNVSRLLTVLMAFVALAQRNVESQALASPSLATTQAGPIFLTAPAYANGNAASSVISGDFNKDGKLDVVVANGCPDQCATSPAGVSVLLGNGDGTLGVAKQYPVAGEGTQSVVAADFNHDGNLDLALANTCFSPTDCSSGGVSFLLGNGNGTFRKGRSYKTGAFYSNTVRLGDFNGDGMLDLLVVDQCLSADCFGQGAFSILLGKADGTFTAAKVYPSAGGDALSAAVGDFNGDGKLDLAVMNDCESNNSCKTNPVGVFLGNGNGTFQAPATYNLNSIPSSIIAADLTGNGKLALVTTHGDGTVKVLLGNGDGTFQSARTYDAGGLFLTHAEAVDLNGDGKLDLAISAGNRASSGEASILLGRGNGTFGPPQGFASGAIGALSLTAGDFNGDGKPDLVVASPCIGGIDCPNTPNDGAVSVLLGKGGGAFQAARMNPFFGCIGAPDADAVASGDFNHDGKLDLAVAGCGRIDILMGKGNGTFQSGPSIPLPEIYIPSLVVGDFNHDGKLDLALAANCPGIHTCGQDGSGGVSVLLGNDDGTFQAERHIALGISVYSVAIGDFNQDGNPDLVAVVTNNCRGVPNCFINAVTILLGQGDGSFQLGQSAPTDGYLAAGASLVNTFVAVGDFDKDGKDDLAVVSPCVTQKDCSASVLRVFMGKGDGTFRGSVPHAGVGAYAVAVTTGDFNGDGRADLAVTTRCTTNCPSADQGAITLFLGGGDGKFQTGQTYASGGIRSYATIAADFNGDGKLDLLVANESNSGLLLGVGDGTFQPAQTYNVGGFGLVAGDFNRDGRPDVAVAGTVILTNIARFPQ